MIPKHRRPVKKNTSFVNHPSMISQMISQKKHYPKKTHNTSIIIKQKLIFKHISISFPYCWWKKSCTSSSAQSRSGCRHLGLSSWKTSTFEVQHGSWKSARPGPWAQGDDLNLVQPSLSGVHVNFPGCLNFFQASMFDWNSHGENQHYTPYRSL